MCGICENMKQLIASTLQLKKAQETHLYYFSKDTEHFLIKKNTTSVAEK